VATEQEILNLIYQYQGADALKQAKQDLEDAKAATAALGDQFKQGAIDEAAFREGIRFQAQTIADSKEKIEAFERAARGGASGMAGFGQSMLQTGRIVQDFTQGGIGGILNNIEGITMALGGPAGLAGVLTVVGVGFYLLKPKIEEFMKSLLDDAPVTFADRLAEMHKKIKELEDKPHKIAVEVDELRDAKEQVEAIEAGLKKIEQMRKTQEHYERESGRQIAEIFAEEPAAPAAREALIAQEIARQREATPELTAGIPRLRELEGKVADLRRTLDEERAAGGITLERELQLENRIQNADRHRLDLQNRLNTVAQSVEERATAEVGRVFTQAEEGGGVKQQQAQEDLARRLGQVGQPDLAAAVQLSKPSVIRTEEQIDERLEAGNEQAKRVREAQQKRARDAALAEKRRGDEAERINREKAAALTQQQRDREQTQREEEQQQRARTQEIHQELGGLAREIKPTGIEEQAALFAARLRTRRDLTPEQQQLNLRRGIGQELRQAAPGLTRPQVAGLTEQIAQGANRQAESVMVQQRAAIAQQARVTGQTLNAGQLNVMATQRTLVLLQGLIPRVEAVEQAAMANLRRAEQMQARTKPAGRGPGRR
jgi:hypothetical protein